MNKDIIVTNMPERYKYAVEEKKQGKITEISYCIKNYINHSRKLVTDRIIDNSVAGRQRVEGDGIFKKCNVYLPAGYDPDCSTTRYDVLYLLHGVGGDRFEWLNGNGKTDRNYNICNILDNLIANGEIDPLIVVFTDGRSSHDWTDCSFNPEGTNMLGFYYFDYELRCDLIPFIESTYNTYSSVKDITAEAVANNRLHRAIAGLSIGGMQTLNLTLGGYRCDSTLYTGTNSPWKNGLDTTVTAPGMVDLFAYAGAFSNAPTSSTGKILGAGLAAGSHNLNLLYITCGDADNIAYQEGYETASSGLAEAAGDNLGDYYRVIIKNSNEKYDII